MHFYQFNIGDYAKKTQHLTNEEDLAYRRLLDMYYDTENPVLTSGLATLSRRLRVSEKALENVLAEFFPDGKNKHADEKIAEYYAYIERQKANGSKGGRRKKNPPLTQAKPSANPSPSQPEAINHESIKQSKPSDAQKTALDFFEEAWKIYPQREGANRKQTLKAWEARIKAKVSPEVMIEGAKRYARYCLESGTESKYIKLPSVFFGTDEHFRSNWTVTTKSKLSSVVPAIQRTCTHCKEPAHMEISGRWYCRNHDQYSTSEAA